MSSILLVAGTHRPNSNALKVSQILRGHYEAAGVVVDVLSLSELPPEAFLPTVYASKPASVLAIGQRVLSAAGVHIVTPEYNGSFPGVLKHFIDLLKFPESFQDKPVAFTGESNGVWGGLRAVEHLMQVFSYRNAHIYPGRVFIPGVTKKFDAEGQLNDAEIAQRLAEQAAGFVKYVARFVA